MRHISITGRLSRWAPWQYWATLTDSAVARSIDHSQQPSIADSDTNHVLTPTDTDRIVTDGGTNRDEFATPTPGVLRQSAVPDLFAVDADDRLTTVTDSLSARAAAEAETLSGQHLSSLLAVPDGDFATHLRTVRRRLQKGSPTVRSGACLLRTADGRQSVTVEFSTYPDAGTDAGGLVGVVREPVAEIGESQPQPSESSPRRFRALFEQLPDPVAEVRFVDRDEQSSSGSRTQSGDREERSSSGSRPQADTTEPIVTSVNPAFEETFGYDHADLVGEPLNEYIVPEDADDDTELDREAANGEWTSAEVIREAVDGPRLFLFRSIPFSHDGAQHSFGVYTDVTDRESQQRYHEVLNRLLRHNLRNDLNVILGLADQLAAELDATETDMTAVGDRLKQRALDLIETTRRARELESVINRSETDTSPTAIGDLVATVREELRVTYPNATIAATIDKPAVAVAGPAIREAVIELAENAVEHTAVDPTIHLRVAALRDGSVVITVADDGPGIPAGELAVVEGSQSITPLDHCSGLGLWLAKWIVEAYGGELAFVGPDPELGGAAVELHLRQLPTGADTPDRAAGSESPPTEEHDT